MEGTKKLIDIGHDPVHRDFSRMLHGHRSAHVDPVASSEPENLSSIRVLNMNK